MSPAPARLVLPLRRLAPPPRTVPHLLHLDEPSDDGLAAWAVRTREAAEPCLLLDTHGRVAAMSAGCGELLDVDPAEAVGALLLDLLGLVDFSATGVPLVDQETHVPPLRSLRGGGMARGLVRLRLRGQLQTFDVVSVALAAQAGVLAFFSEV